MVLVLAIAVGPGAIAMTVSWMASDHVIRSRARHDALRAAGEYSRRLGEEVQARATQLSALARDPALHDAARRFMEQGQPAADPGPRRAFEGPVYLVDSTGRVAASLEDGCRWTPLAQFPSVPGLRDFAAAVALREEDGVVLSEAPSATLLVAAPLPGEGGALATVLDVATLCARAEAIDRQMGQRLLLISRRGGVLHSSQPDAELEAAIDQIRPRLFYEDAASRMESLTVRSVPLAVAVSPVRPVRALSEGEPGIQPADWVAAYLLDMRQLLAPMERVQWVLVIAGLGLLLVALALSAWVSGMLVRPIRALRDGLEQFTAGNLGHRVDVRTHDELEALASAANELAASLRRANEINRAQLVEVGQKARQLELIHGISHSVNRFLDLDLLFERITNELRAQIPCDRMSLALLNDSRTRLVLEHVFPAERSLLPRGTEILPERSILWRALDEGAVTLARLGEGDDFEDVNLSKLGMKILAVVPLTATSGKIGTFNLAAKDPSAIGETEVRLLGQVAESVALAVEHGRLYGQVARFAERLEEMVEQRTAQLRRAQARLSAAERFAATGSMAAHIAHEVNNPLSIIKNYLRIVSSRMEKTATQDEECRSSALEGLRVIEDEIDRIARIVAQLRQIANPAKLHVEEVDLAEEMRVVAELFEASTRRRRIEVELELDPALGAVEVCRDHLRQILINLARNAIDAMDEEGGVLTLRTAADPTDPARYRVEVADTGPGIPPEMLRRVFDPFFTTKVDGKGSGLGLSVSQSLAQSMGGTLEAFSARDEGTLFRLVLPRHATRGEDSRDEEGATRVEPFVRREGGRIIVG